MFRKYGPNDRTAVFESDGEPGHIAIAARNRTAGAFLELVRLNPAEAVGAGRTLIEWGENQQREYTVSMVEDQVRRYEYVVVASSPEEAEAKARDGDYLSESDELMEVTDCNIIKVEENP